MRLTAGWLLLLNFVLLFAGALPAARMTNDCCCTGMSSNTCPLKQPGRRSCDSSGRTCSIRQADAGTAAQYLRSLDTRDPSTLTWNPVRVWPPSAALSFASPASPHPEGRHPSPETPPPRTA
jgi:hypothetical protein